MDNFFKRSLQSERDKKKFSNQRQSFEHKFWDWIMYGIGEPEQFLPEHKHISIDTPENPFAKHESVLYTDGVESYELLTENYYK
jgi:hypothetical protein